jgi:hypothetical protein
MKLYKVEMTFETVVLAESSQAAEREARYNIGEEDPIECWVSGIRALGDLPDQWDGDCIPWGGGHNVKQHTIKQILENDES